MSEEKQPQKRISINLIFNILCQLTYFIVPVFITPYISRVLNAELIGEYSFTLANSNYFVLAETLGFTLYGQIKIAAVRDDKNKLSLLFWELFFIKCFLMMIASASYIPVILTAGSTRLRTLYVIMLINIVSNGLDITWFLNGLEEFKVTALRTIFIKLCNLAAVYLFVKDESDIFLYALIMQGFILIGFISVYPILRKKIRWTGFKALCIRQHIKPSFVYLIPGVVNTVFTSVDKTLLGTMISDANEVGYYQQASSLITAFTTMINSISNVLLPRIAYLHYNTTDEKEEKRLMKIVTGIGLAFAIPIMFGLIAVSDEFIPIYLGPGYEKSALLLKILSANVILVVICNYCGQLCLVAKGKQMRYNIVIIIGAIVNIVLNLCLIQAFSSAGVAIASIVSNFTMLIPCLIWSRHSLTIWDLFIVSWKYVIAAVAMFVCIFFFSVNLAPIFHLVIKIIIGIIVYFILLLVFRDETLFFILRMIFKKKSKGNTDNVESK